MSRLPGEQRLQRVASNAGHAVQWLAQPSRLQRVQHVLLLLMVLWGLNSFAQLFWVVWPTPDPAPPDGAIVNPATTVGAGSAGRTVVSVDDALGLGLFGNPEAAAIETVVEANSAPRDGIEQGASETRLALRLTGIVASTEDGLGSAVIAAKNVEATYAVGDALPVSGDVTLAKVMATQVVISNNGTYELLKLFEDSTLSAMVPEASARPAQQPARTQPAVEVSSGAQAAVDPSQQAAVARAVRERLYDNPQSLARLVQVAAVRDEQGIRGYRVSPGQDAAQFRALGFQPGDVITSVNGLSLSDPANTVRLYQMMRDARDATIEVERNGSTTSLSVSLDSQAGE